MAELSIAERVANGVKWLDESKPGWYAMVDPVLLDLSKVCYCVLGQVFGHYWDAPEIERGWDSQAEAASRGFNVLPPADRRDDPGPDYEAQCLVEYAALDAEWKRVIAERRATVGAVSR